MSTLFSPSLVRDLSYPGYTFKQVTQNMLTGSSPPDDVIWRDDPYGTGLKSTQQVDLDWTDFTTHTFFNSAESKVNVAFERIINQFPFDGSKTELLGFMDSLNGYESYIFGRFPKFIGDLKFNKAQSQHILSQDKSGYLFPEISRNLLGERAVGTAANIGEFTTEFWLYASSSTAYDNEVIFQKLNTENNHGVSVFLSQSLSGNDNIPVVFGISSGSSYISSSIEVPKGQFVHVACTYDKNDLNAIKMYRNSLLIASSSAAEIDVLSFYDKDILIGSGSAQLFDGVTFLPKETLNTNLDEFRFWKTARDQSLINEFYDDNVFQNDDLAVYYRFNEPTGSYTSKAITLDHSGNGLHGQIQNYTDAMRGSNEQQDLPMYYERLEHSPVLFPDYTDLLTINRDLLTSGSRYDANNPNLITRLVPRHYFLEAQAEEGHENEDGTLSDEYGYFEDTVFPGGGKIPTAQIFSSFLFIWASFFDEIKLYLDAFSKLHDINHQALDSIPAQFLQKLGRRYGIELPNSFSSVSIDGFSNGRDLSNDSPYSTLPLRKIQEMLWRRLLREMPTIQRMKGTVQSVKSLMLSLGVNPDTAFRIREYGGPTTKKLKTRLVNVNSFYNSIDFSKGSSPFLQTKDTLQGYRHEPGFPHGGPTPEIILIDHMGAESSTIKVAIPGTGPISTSFTSASWAWEGNYVLKNDPESTTQSLFRLEHSASLSAGTQPSIVVNLTAVSGSDRSNTPSSLILAFSGSATSKMAITGSGINIFDGSSWYVNLNHTAKEFQSEFLVRAYKTNGVDVVEKHYMSGSYTNSKDGHTAGASGNDLRNVLTAQGGEGNRIAIGYNAPSNYNSDHLSYSGDDATKFNGKLSSFRFWSKALNEKEASTHALNPFSVGSSSPLVNSSFLFRDNQPIHKISTIFNTGSLPMGSFERLRLASDLQQQISSSNSTGRINIVDNSRSSAPLLSTDVNSRESAGFIGHGFTANTEIFTPIQRFYARIDPNYDVTINTNKVRIKSALDIDLAEELDAESGTLYELDPREPITDDRRFSVEASIVQALNEDIVNILADNQYINDAMGTPETMFAVNYPALERLSDKYFYRLTDKINTSEYLKFFKWFDNNFGMLIEKLVPRTTEFLGINFVIESHMLERHRFEYKQADVHIDLNSRLAARIDPVLEGRIRNEAT